MYEVIHFFTDLQDFNHAYNAGDEFPRPGMAVSRERLEELSGSRNKQRKPLIRLVAEEKPASESDAPTQDGGKPAGDGGKAYTKTEINRLPKSGLVSLAEENGIKNASELSGNELKARLISIFNL